MIMKLKLILLLFYFTAFLQCNPDNEPILQGEFEFIEEYTTMVTVGGVVGITDRTFRIGEIYFGIYKGEETIKIRIANHLDIPVKLTPVPEIVTPFLGFSF